MNSLYRLFIRAHMNSLCRLNILPHKNSLSYIGSPIIRLFQWACDISSVARKSEVNPIIFKGFNNI